MYGQCTVDNITNPSIMVNLLFRLFSPMIWSIFDLLQDGQSARRDGHKGLSWDTRLESLGFLCAVLDTWELSTRYELKISEFLQMFWHFYQAKEHPGPGM